MLLYRFLQHKSKIQSIVRVRKIYRPDESLFRQFECLFRELNRATLSVLYIDSRTEGERFGHVICIILHSSRSVGIT